MTEDPFVLSRYWPSPDVGAFVERYWVVTWDLTGQEPHAQELLPNPCVNLVIDRDEGSRAYGVQEGRYVRVLAGTGRVLGVKFRPGGFYPFLGRSVSSLRGRSNAMEAVFGADSRWLEKRILSAESDRAMVDIAEEFFRSRLPAADGNVDWVNQIIDRIVTDRAITKVRDLEVAVGTSARTIQRLFERYVGTGPKQVIAYYRLQEAVAQMEADPYCNLAELASELGYTDQAHFGRTFKSLVGTTPAAYRRAASKASKTRKGP